MASARPFGANITRRAALAGRSQRIKIRRKVWTGFLVDVPCRTSLDVTALEEIAEHDWAMLFAAHAEIGLPPAHVVECPYRERAGHETSVVLRN